MRAAVAGFLLDAALVLLFALLGRASHAEGLTWPGVLEVAWPFLVALAASWAVARRRGAWPTGVAGSPWVWVVTVVLGLALRVATGGGFAWSFGLVTLVVLGVFLVGWRCVGDVVRFGAAGLARWSEEAARRSSR